MISGLKAIEEEYDDQNKSNREQSIRFLYFSLKEYFFSEFKKVGKGGRYLSGNVLNVLHWSLVEYL